MFISFTYTPANKMKTFINKKQLLNSMSVERMWNK